MDLKEIIRTAIKKELDEKGIRTMKQQGGLLMINMPFWCLLQVTPTSVSIKFIKGVGHQGRREHEIISFGNPDADIANPSFDPQKVISDVIKLLEHLNAIRLMGKSSVRDGMDPLIQKSKITEAFAKTKYYIQGEKVLSFQKGAKGSTQVFYKGQSLGNIQGYYENGQEKYVVAPNWGSLDEQVSNLVEYLNSKIDEIERHLQKRAAECATTAKT